MNKEEIFEDIIDEMAIDLCCSFHQGQLDVTDMRRVAMARRIAQAIPSPLNSAFVEAMANPLPLYSALKSVGHSDWSARFKIGGLATSAVGRFGLQPSDFAVGPPDKRRGP